DVSIQILGERLTTCEPPGLRAGGTLWQKVRTETNRGFDAQASSQSCFSSRRVGNPFSAGDQGDAEGNAADSRQAVDSLRGRGGEGRGDRAVLLCHEPGQECDRRPFRPSL